MSIFRSGNPVLSEKRFQENVGFNDGQVMTQSGTMNKFFLMSLLLISSAVFTWNAFYQGVNIMPWMLGSVLLGLVVALVLTFKPVWGSFLAPIYALLEGVFLGSISAIYNNVFAKVAPGIVTQAVGLTFGVVIAMFVLYKFNVIKVTEQLKSIIVMATAGIAIFYLIAMVLRFFNIDIMMVSDANRGSMLGIGISLFVVGIAALNLLLDFDRIDSLAKQGAPKYMEWYGAFGLMVTIVWLYLEILRLLSRFASNKN
ncbi:Bax inhibitor-1/YccA family protein [Chitinophagaceae bacterium 26-R-25]|nr:Bax inhibitor-1/YccA family protein [Chitinophagaceae bacterium 26-R-25]